MVGVLLYSLIITPQRSVLDEQIPPTQSPLIPDAFKVLDIKGLNALLAGANEIPLKTFLPRAGLDELVEPCAAMGVANVRDMLRLNRLALRDIGVGPKEQRFFMRALEKSVKLREKMQEVFMTATNKGRSSSMKRSTTMLLQAAREQGARNKAPPPTTILQRVRGMSSSADLQQKEKGRRSRNTSSTSAEGRSQEGAHNAGSLGSNNSIAGLRTGTPPAASGPVERHQSLGPRPNPTIAPPLPRRFSEAKLL